MENVPYTPPPYYRKVCSDPARRSAFEAYPHVDCESDPYYPERRRLYDNARAAFKAQRSKVPDRQNVFYEYKRRWRKILRGQYDALKSQLPYENIDGLVQTAHDLFAAGRADDVVQHIVALKRTTYTPDPFYSFNTLVDYFVYMMSRDSTRVPDAALARTIAALAQYGLVGVSQVRFYLYYAVMFRSTAYFDALYGALRRTVARDVRTAQQLLTDVLVFAYMQLHVDHVHHTLTAYPRRAPGVDVGVAFEDIPQKLRESACYKRSAIAKNRKKNSLFDQYYITETCPVI